MHLSGPQDSEDNAREPGPAPKIYDHPFPALWSWGYMLYQLRRIEHMAPP